MGQSKKLKVILYGAIYTLERGDIEEKRGEMTSVDYDMQGFGEFYVDKAGRFLRAYQPFRSWRQDADWFETEPYPVPIEIYEEVIISEEDTGEVYATLKNVTISEALRVAADDRDERARKFQEEHYDRRTD